MTVATVLTTSRFLAAAMGEILRNRTKRRRFFAIRARFLADLLASRRKITRWERASFPVGRINFEFRFELI